MIYPDWLIQDIRNIKLIPEVSNLTHKSLSNYAEVCFDMSYGEYAQTNNERLKNPEPIILRYKLSKSPSDPDFLSNRSCFPRNLPHLNPVDVEEPVSICLWRKGGNSALYLQKGIVACLDVLRNWLEDASISNLQHDGWEPIPRGGFISFNVNLGNWQDLANQPKFYGKTLTIESLAMIFKEKRSIQIGLVTPALKYKIKSISADYLRPISFDQVCPIRTYFLIPDQTIEYNHNSLKLNSFDNLLAYSSSPQLSQLICNIQNSKKRKGMSAGVLAIAQRRPLQLINDIPSLSNDENARKIEILAVLIIHDSTGFTFQELRIKSPPTSKMLSDVSGVDITNKEISILGCGSVGGAITDFLVRAGHKQFKLWDDDCFEAHNNARHILHQTYVEQAIVAFGFKASKMQKRMMEINPEVDVKSYTQKFDAQELSKLTPSTHIIDATGVIIEHSWLNHLTIPYSRVFIADQGSLAFLLTQTPSETADMLDIEGVLFTLASTNENIRNWLQRNSQLSDKMLGLSCSSSTMEMPWFKISNHVSALIPSLHKQLKCASTCAVMNILSDEGNPKGLIEFDTQKPNFIFKKIQIDDTDGMKWTVSFSQKVEENIHRIRTKFLPAEAAGYLLGLYNIDTRRISIVAATQGPFESSSSAATLEEIDKDIEAQDFINNSNNMLKPLGTWHSHPGKSAHPSSRDKETFKEVLTNENRTIPTVMLIFAESEVNCLVGISRDI